MDHVVDSLASTSSTFWHKVRAQYNRCKLFYDGYEYQTPDNGTVVGQVIDYSGDFFTVPVPGINGVHQIEPDLSPADDKDYFVWCGEIADLVPYYGPRHGAQLTLRSTPQTIDAATERVLDDRFMCVFIPLVLRCFDIFPIDLHIIYLMGFHMGLLSHRRYFRDDFLFIKAFDRTSWLSIIASLMLVSFVMTIIWRLTTRVSKNRKSFVQKLLSFGDNYVNLTIKMAGLLSGEPPELGSWIPRWMRHKAVYACWLLMSTILSACLAGSMRDLMSEALEMRVPHHLCDLTSNPTFADYTLLLGPNTKADLDDSQKQNPEDAVVCFRELQDAGRTLPLPLETCISEGLNCISILVTAVAQYWSTMAIELNQLDLPVGFYLFDLYADYIDDKMRQSVASLPDSVFAYLEDQWNIFDDGEGTFASSEESIQARREWGAKQWLQSMALQEGYLAEELRAKGLYMSLSKSVPESLYQLVSDSMLRVSEAGIPQWSLDTADAKMRARGLQPREPPRVTRLKMFDFYGGLQLSGGFVMVSWLAYVAEFLWKR